MAAAKNTTKTATKDAKSQPDHPKYIEAIIELKDRTGSSRQAIKKYILSKYTLIESVAIKQINLTLKRGLEQKIIYCPQGHSNSYKLFKQEKPKAKKPVAKKVAEKKKPTTATTKKAAATTTKKAATTTKKAAPTKKAAAPTKKAAATTKKTTTKTAAAPKKTIKKKSSSSATKKSTKTTKSKK
ncbi:winged helix DNA-binding domain-containing protein [Piromyces finnis]|uniref:Histone H1 n=1 Tax=Piromyces finnis TaxID=1754191 RepID=A0A1Y1V7D9_9FUNG|nr:winged helix DNA-binding domain-containing protein [Piromyces finnis]|eukprot:ORX47813.1 winged helix DNA-binding domain-containing protein [Piromyces finnis]